MSAPPSQAKPPGDDFVLWPESLGRSPGSVSEAVIRQSLAGLAPTEWVDDDPTSQELGGAGKPELAGKEERFYPASRQWFRTTTSIPAADATEKWWQEVPASPPSPVSEPPPTPPPVPPGVPASTVSSDLLSPEEIWELAADELAQASRLGAPPEVSASTRADKALVGPEGGPHGPGTPGAPPPTTPVEPVVAPTVEAPAGVRLPSLGPAGKAGEGEAAAGLPETPVIVVPRPSAPAPSSLAPVLPAAASAAPSTTAAAIVDAATVEGGTDPPLVESSGPAPLEALPAIPGAGRLPLSLRTEKSRTPFPLQRRKPTPGSAEEPVFAGLGMAAGDEPETGDGMIAVEEATADAVPSTGQHRRRTREGRRPPHEPAPSRRTWLGWCAGTLGLLLVVAAVAAVVARDQLPADWRRSAEGWWQKGHRLLFPHQYGYRRRGVVPRVGQPQGNPPIPAGDKAAAVPPPDGSLEPKAPPPLIESPATAAIAPPNGVSSPPPPPLVEAAQPRTPAPALPPTATVDAPVAQAPADPTGEIFAPRAEPVPEDEAQLAPEETAADVPPSAPAQGSDPAVPGTAPGNKSPDAPPAPVSPQEGPVQALSPTSGAFTLWDGDEPPEPDGSPAEGGPSRRRETPSETTNAELAEGKKAVQRLVAARSAAEVLPWIFDADTLETAVRSYYAQHPLQPLMDAVIEHEYSGIIPATGGKAHIFNVLAASHPRGFPVSAEATPQGYRIDWQSYIQWRDGWLRRFLDSKSETPQTLFVVLRRTHYFNDDVPKLDEKLAFKLTSAVPNDEGAVAFVDKNSAVGRSLAEMYEWRTMYFPVVELQWVPAGREGRYLRLNRIVRPTWRRIGE